MKSRIATVAIFVLFITWPIGLAGEKDPKREAVIKKEQPAAKQVSAKYILESAPSNSVSKPQWHIRGSASGTGYQLTALPQNNSAASGCCCLYLPCVIR